MARYKFLAIALIMALSLHQAFGIKCWVCNNLAQRWCNDPLDVSQMSDLEKILLADCPSNKCVKMSEVNSLNNGKPTVVRVCAKNDADASQLCTNDTGKTDFKCEICETDGCNSAAQYGPVALLVLIPMAIAKLLTF